MNLANEGLEARKKEDEVNARKRKAEDQQAWEGMQPYLPVRTQRVLTIFASAPAGRDERVGSWRNFAQSKEKKKKKQKIAILG